MKKNTILCAFAALALLGAGCSTSSQTTAEAPAVAPPAEQTQPTAGTEQPNEYGNAPQAAPSAQATPQGSATAEASATTQAAGTTVQVHAVAREPQTIGVTIQNYAYSEPALSVTRGDKVIFINKDSMRHSVTADDGKSFDSGLLGMDASWTLDTSKLEVGTYAFHCQIHSSMHGTLTIHN